MGNNLNKKGSWSERIKWLETGSGTHTFSKAASWERLKLRLQEEPPAKRDYFLWARVVAACTCAMLILNTFKTGNKKINIQTPAVHMHKEAAIIQLNNKASISQAAINPGKSLPFVKQTILRKESLTGPVDTGLSKVPVISPAITGTGKNYDTAQSRFGVNVLPAQQPLPLFHINDLAPVNKTSPVITAKNIRVWKMLQNLYPDMTVQPYPVIQKGGLQIQNNNSAHQN